MRAGRPPSGTDRAGIPWGYYSRARPTRPHSRHHASLTCHDPYGLHGRGNRPPGPDAPVVRDPAAPRERPDRQSVQPFSPVAASTAQAFASVAEATGTIIV
ncbi:hypothetical protein GCM10010478_25780 [Streptomyces erythrogriseus]|uniref:Uncharacterized protein n=3 Tax=Streptomyces TaxID=1883 RepID=A0ABN3WQE8_9ACTN|nr:hypothetical protein GCM10010265_54380 [Streptomyces griseoincarnatus]GGT66683.1 hypothetical protein GCM10010287_46480 [Streptomyces variabilis]